MEQFLLTRTGIHGEELQPMDRNLQPMDRTHTEAGEKCEKEGEAGRGCHVLIVTSHSPSPLHLLDMVGGYRGPGNERVKLSG